MGFEDVLDYYELLDVKRNSSTKTIEAGYRRMAKKFHPDGEAGDEGNSRIFDALTQARNTLVDEQLRRAYDAWLEAGKREPPPTSDETQSADPGFSRTQYGDTVTENVRASYINVAAQSDYLINRSWQLGLVSLGVTVFSYELFAQNVMSTPDIFFLLCAVWTPFWVVPKKWVTALIKLAKARRESALAKSETKSR